MAQIADARKVFNFRIEMDGIDQFEIQKATPPEVEVESVSHGDANSDVKTAGRVKVADLVCEKLKPLPASDLWAWDWLQLAQNMGTGGGGLASSYKKTIVLKELAPDNVTTINRWILEGCWVKKLSQSDFDRNASDNVIETVTISVDKCRKY